MDNPEIIRALCHRRFGIGADGLILLEESDKSDFKMIYFNSDGNEGSMCGNGGRCITAFAAYLGIISDTTQFEAVDGLHQAQINSAVTNGFDVSLKMQDVTDIKNSNGAYILDTGSPHYVSFCKNTSDVDVMQEGKKIRYSEPYKTHGINVNFISVNENSFSIRTYERGVEDETFSCGTGTVAAAIALDAANMLQNKNPVKFDAPGGKLEVSHTKSGNKYTDIWLTGNAIQVFEGTILL